MFTWLRLLRNGMIDFVIGCLLITAAVVGIRRVRRYGFGGLRVPAGLLEAVTALVRAPEGPERGLAGPEPQPPSAPAEGAAAATPVAVAEAGEAPAEAEAIAPSRRLSRLAWAAAVALVLASVQLQRQLWEEPNDLIPLWQLIAVAVGFAAVVRMGLPVPGLPRGPDRGWQPTQDEGSATGILGRGASSAAVVYLVGGAALCEVLALLFFERGALANLAWLLHVAAGGLFLAGVWRGAGTDYRKLAGSWSRVDTAAVAALILVALGVRLWRLGEVPEGIWFDEAQRGIEALRIAANPEHRPVFISAILQEPTAYLYLLVPFLQVLGQESLALRLPSAIGGALAVGALYLLARILFDRRTALVAAGLAVGMTWHLNYSRIAFLAIWSLFLDALAAAFLVLGLRRNSPAAFAAAGLSSGWGMHFYYSSWLLPFVLVATVLHRLIGGRMGFVRTYGVGLVVGAIGFAIASAPIAQFAVLHTDQFRTRLDTASVLKEVEQAGSWQPVIESVKAHLLMFNARGDPNGRHNWTGRPMLDEVTGALAVLGLALALTFWRRPEGALLVVWVPVALLGGILSISWEAPQSHRAVGAVTPVLLLAALPLGTLWGLSGPLVAWGRQALGAPGRLLVGRTGLAPAAYVLIPIVVVGTVVHNVNRYFNHQQRDFRTWMEFSAPQTEAGRQINDIPLGWKIYLDPVLAGQPSVVFVVREGRPSVPFDPAGHLPISDEAAAILLTDRQPSLAARIAALYPSARRQLLYAPDSDRVVLYSFLIGPAEVSATRGALARYGPADSAVEEQVPELSFAWPRGSPLEPPFPATFEATLTAPTYGPYRFKLEGPPDARLVLNGLPVLAGGRETQLTLARGSHALRLEAPRAGNQPLRLLWALSHEQLRPIPTNALHVPPIRATGLLARLYRGPQPSGEPASQHVDPAVELRVHALPLPRPYTIEWTGALRASQAGVYRFGTSSIDASEVWVDGQQVVSNTTHNAYMEGSIELEAGWHDLRVGFLDATSFTHISLYWQPPGGRRVIIPSDALRPWPAGLVASAQPEDLDLSRPIAGEAPWGLAAEPTAPGGARTLVPAGALSQPRAAAMAPDGTVYIADAGRKAVIALPPGGEPRTLGEGQLKEPSAVAVLRDRSLVVVDAGAGAVWRMGSDGTIGERLAPDQGLYGPRGIAVAPDGRLALADTGNNRVLVLSATGALSQTIGGLKEPTDAAFLSDGTLLVAETGAKQLTIVKPDGQRGSSWPMPAAYTVVGPHIAVLPGGGWVATAPEARALLRMAPNGRSPQTWTPDPNWRKPVGVAAGPLGLVVVDTDAATATLFDLP